MQLIKPKVYFQTEVHHQKLFFMHFKWAESKSKPWEGSGIGRYICHLFHNITSLLLNVVSAHPFACKTNNFDYLANT